MSRWFMRLSRENAAYRFPVFVALALCSAVLLAGCGGVGGQTAEGGAPTGATPAVKPTPTITVTATVNTNGGTPVAGAVTLTLDKQQYGPNDTITITVTNGGSADIFAANHQTACTIITLEVNVNGAWQPIHNCQQMSATRLIKIAAGATSIQTLTPGSGQIVGKPWATGTYRATLAYGTGSAPTPNAGKLAITTTFTIS